MVFFRGDRFVYSAKVNWYNPEVVIPCLDNSVLIQYQIANSYNPYRTSFFGGLLIYKATSIIFYTVATEGGFVSDCIRLPFISIFTPPLGPKAIPRRCGFTG